MKTYVFFWRKMQIMFTPSLFDRTDVFHIICQQSVCLRDKETFLFFYFLYFGRCYEKPYTDVLCMSGTSCKDMSTVTVVIKNKLYICVRDIIPYKQSSGLNILKAVSSQSHSAGGNTFNIQCVFSFQDALSCQTCMTLNFHDKHRMIIKALMYSNSSSTNT